MKRTFLTISGLMFFVLQFHSQPFGLEINTHKDLNRFIAQNSINRFSLDQYLVNQLGFKIGVKTLLGSGNDGKVIWEWVRDGGQYEDEPGYSRSFNHFHDPLIEPWTSAGFNKAGVSPFKSALVWAQDQGAFGSLFGGDWSWKKARDSFRKGLTGLNQDDRDRNLADTFRALGQIMHLVQDVSVPAHVRNDGHVYFDDLPLGMKKAGKFHYEVWVDKHRGSLNLAPSEGDIFDPSILGSFYESSAPIPIANIFDTGKYDGSNPNIAVGTRIGLAEFTNANFFSEDTIFQDYPHPAFEDTNYLSIDWKHPEIADAEDGKLDNRIYINRMTVAEPIKHLATLSYISYDCIKKGHYQFSPVVLDDEVYKEYASKLIPRAVGYSAGLLQYFFRGQLHIEALVPSIDPLPSVDQSGYHFGNREDTGTDINTVAVFLQNNSRLKDAIEPAGNGTLTLTIGYTDTEDGSKVYQTAGTASVTEIPAVGSGKTLPILFPVSPPIQTQKARDLTYYFAFKGKLGQEEDAVIGKVVKGPALHSVTPDEGTEGTVVTIAGDNLPDPVGQPETRGVCFSVDLTKPYIIELISRTETEIKVKVPNTASLVNPGYGGLRVKNVLEGEEVIYSNPLSFFPIAEGEIENSAQVPLNITIEATRPIYGDYKELPRPISYPVLKGDSVSIQLMTGFIYHVTGGATDMTKDIKYLTPDLIDFVLQVH